MFNAPIPGQSLTSEPKNYPWENPPEFPEPEDALMFHMERLEDPKKIKAMMSLLELGLDVTTMTEGILRGAVAEGRHSIDVSLIIAPIIHEYIVGTAEAAGVEYNEGFDESLDDEKLEYDIEKTKARRILAKMEGEKPEVDLSPLEEAPTMPEEQPQVEQEEQQPMGLMARRM